MLSSADEHARVVSGSGKTKKKTKKSTLRKPPSPEPVPDTSSSSEEQHGSVNPPPSPPLSSGEPAPRSESDLDLNITASSAQDDLSASPAADNGAPMSPGLDRASKSRPLLSLIETDISGDVGSTDKVTDRLPTMHVLDKTEASGKLHTADTTQSVLTKDKTSSRLDESTTATIKTQNIITPQTARPVSHPPSPHSHLFRQAVENSPSKSLSPGSRGYHCAFDSFDNTGAGSGTAVLVGWEGGLDVFRVLKSKTEVVGRLEGLRGSVIDAKLLTWTEIDDPLKALRPLVACTVHGPMLDRGTSHYQTTIQVFSLVSSRQVATLLSSQPIPQTTHRIPSSVEHWKLAAAGRFLTVASGVSGEIHIFSPIVAAASTADTDAQFQCIGKFWTGARTKHFVEGQDCVAECKTAIFALSARWLAVKPPMTSASQVSTQSEATCGGRQEAPGLSSYVSPPPPNPTCGVDAQLDSSLINRVTKQATREIRKGAQWVGEQGKQAWNSYWNTTSPVQGELEETHILHDSTFPPTHAHDESQPRVIESSLVSIIDLNRLLEHNVKTPTPVATFELLEGCTYMSFDPQGTSLFVTNHVGDASSILSLSKMASGYRPSRSTSLHSQGQLGGIVNMTARFARLSPSVVSDVCWTARANRVAVTTERGTVHLHEVPRQEPTWPFASRTMAAVAMHDGDESSGNILSNVKAGWQSIHTLASRTRRSSGNFGLPTLSTIGSAGVAARQAGGRAVRQGLTKGLGMAAEGAHHIRHADDNKIRLRPARHPVKSGCVRWMGDVIATVVDGRIALQHVKNGFHTQGKRTIVSLNVSKRPFSETTLPGIPADMLPPAAMGVLDPEGPHSSCSREGVHGFWTLGRPGATTAAGPISQDKETSSSHLPFHRLPQVALFVTRDPVEEHEKKGVAWTFGQDLSNVQRVDCQQSGGFG